VRVVADDLRLSALQVDMNADTLRLRHGTADGRIEAAQNGIPGVAAAALTGAQAKWQHDTSMHFTKLVEHGTGLRTGAAAYDDTDAHSAGALRAAGEAVPYLDLGL
jgi:uncharacterized protein YukE